MSITRADMTSFAIAYFRSLPEFESEEVQPNPECAVADSVKDKPDEEAVLGDDDDEEAVDDSDDDIEGPWYRDRRDVRMIGDILVGVFKEKIKLSLLQQAAASYVASISKNELADRRQLHLDQREFKAEDDDSRAIVETLDKLFLSDQQENSLCAPEAADRAVLQALVKNTAEKIAEKMRPSIVHAYIEAKKKRWIELCGTHRIDKLIDFSHSKKIPFQINVGGFYEKEAGEAWFGVIIREIRGNPLAVYSERIRDKENQVSSFYHELQAVNMALELAIRLNLGSFTMLSTQSDMGFLVMNCQSYEDQCRCDSSEGLKPVEKRCEGCVRRCVVFCQEAEMDERELEMIYVLLIQVMDKLLQLGRMSVTVMGSPSFNTESLNYLAKLKGTKGEIELGDLEHHPELREILFGEASGELGQDGFAISLFH